ncbi:MAG: hypothetical protein INR62_06750 [Rhodospirillales bacterium]|nr:hypothetical protein [Acetobacter sp.]
MLILLHVTGEDCRTGVAQCEGECFVTFVLDELGSKLVDLCGRVRRELHVSSHFQRLAASVITSLQPTAFG